MTWTDPIVDEVRRVREAYAAQFQYDLRAIARDLKTKERCGGRPVVLCAAHVEADRKPSRTMNGPNDIALDDNRQEADRTVIDTQASSPPAVSGG